MKNTKHKTNRYEIIDVARGISILLMFIYHFSYDLNYFGFIEENFYTDKFWITFRNIIVSCFLTIVGISLYLANIKGLNKKRFQQRLVLLIFYSALVSLSSWIMYPKYMIFFGILHFITFASIVGLLFVRCGLANLVLGISLIIFSQYINHPFFDQPFLQWFGLMTHLPATVDYVPFLPWFGVVLIGMFIGKLLTEVRKVQPLKKWQARHSSSKVLALAGRHSLHIYMLHQPLFLGILYIINSIIK